MKPVQCVMKHVPAAVLMYLKFWHVSFTSVSVVFWFIFLSLFEANMVTTKVDIKIFKTHFPVSHADDYFRASDKSDSLQLNSIITGLENKSDTIKTSKNLFPV